MNWMVIPTLALSLLLFVLGQKSMKRCATTGRKTAVSVIFLMVGIPGFLLPLYYLHGFDHALWFYEFRSWPFTELTAAGAGLFAGALAELLKGSTLFSQPVLIALLVLGIIAPHSKQLLAPLPNHRLSDRWDDGVCMQSTPSSCGAASATTLFRSFGESMSESDVAGECFTYLGGTENWYIARAFRQRGYTVDYRIEDAFPADLQTPAIAGVRVGGAGHFIAILSRTNGTCVTGDPLVGREEIPANQITKKFDFTGFFMEIKKQD